MQIFINFASIVESRIQSVSDSIYFEKGGATMAKCAVCEKAVHFGNKVSHSHRRSNKIWKANIKSVRVMVNGGTKKMYVCTSCLRSGKVQRAIGTSKTVEANA